MPRTVRLCLIPAALLTLAACGGAPNGQLAASAGLSRAEAEGLSTSQLALIKTVEANDELNEAQKDAKIARIRAGFLPVFSLGL